MKGTLEAILQRFPEYNEAILKETKENEEFECLCADYGLCIDMLKSLERDSIQKHSIFEEYLEIKTALEQEVLKYLG